jgi:hypothetical protein
VILFLFCIGCPQVYCRFGRLLCGLINVLTFWCLFPGIFLHDPVSFVALVRPDLFTYKNGVVRVETQGICAGHTLMDQGLKRYAHTSVLSFSYCILILLIMMVKFVIDGTRATPGQGFLLLQLLGLLLWMKSSITSDNCWWNNDRYMGLALWKMPETEDGGQIPFADGPSDPVPWSWNWHRKFSSVGKGRDVIVFTCVLVKFCMDRPKRSMSHSMKIILGFTRNSFTCSLNCLDPLFCFSFDWSHVLVVSWNNILKM